MRRRTVFNRWFGRTSILLAWVGLAVALIHPAQGLGIRVCWYAASTGAPCPGCGMTRALSSAARGLFAESWQYHPFGLPLLALFAFTAGLSLMPQATRRRFATSVIRHHRATHCIYLALVVGFTTYGVMRSILFLIGS